MHFVSNYGTINKPITNPAFSEFSCLRSPDNERVNINFYTIVSTLTQERKKVHKSILLKYKNENYDKKKEEVSNIVN